MNKIGLIILREYLTRVRKRSFIIMTILGPVIFAVFIILPGWLATLEEDEVKIIAVIETDAVNHPVPDSLRFFSYALPDNEDIKFQYVVAPVGTLKKTLPETEYYGVVHIPYNVLNNKIIEFYTKKQSSGTKQVEEHITKNLSDFIFKRKLEISNIPIEVINDAQSNVKIKTVKLDKSGEIDQGGQDIKSVIGYVSGFLIYFFIFFFGSQVMRGVIEEKTNRIIEVIISSVKPFQLMAGKIIGIGLTGLTQFLVWILLTFGIITISQVVIQPNNKAVSEVAAQNFMETESVENQIKQEETSEFSNILKDLQGINFLIIIPIFIFYFIGGYILYGSLFAAIGAAVDSETDTQQFMLPVTIPLIFSMLLMINALTNPEGKLAVIFSIIPFTSPIVMMARIGFIQSIPFIQVFSSMFLLFITFTFTIWFAGKIYRTGILMYGKKPTYKEIWKWVRYKN